MALDAAIDPGRSHMEGRQAVKIDPAIGEDGDEVIYASPPKATEVATSRSRVIISAEEYDRLEAIEKALRQLLEAMGPLR